jgi:Zn ribbon nucleic-acid-binding protein
MTYDPAYGYARRTTCDDCQSPITLTTIDGDGVLIGDECVICGYYVTRYMPGREPR